MIRDYKIRAHRDHPSRHRLRPFFLLGIPLALGASGLYAALQILDSPSPSPPLAAEAEGTMLSVPLTLPNTRGPTPAPLPAVEPAASINSLPPPVESKKNEPEIAASPPIPAPEPELSWKSHKIRSGESLAKIFPQLGLSAGLLHRIIHSSEEAAELAHVKPGETLRAGMNPTGELEELVLEHSAISSLVVRSEGDRFTAQTVVKALEPRSTRITGTVKESLFLSAQKAGLSDSLIMELANIFGWDIDFALEIRTGDRFTVIYQEDFLEGEKFRDGPILAAEFVNRGRVYRALRYVDEKGRADYFTPDGKSVRKAFLRSPVDFRRISSRFRTARFHPILGKKRPHRGVDYSAAIGTPIKASGDGKIIYRGNKGGYGRTVILEHGGGISTLYAHLSRYASRQRSGTRVRQGQIIGYVGKSGLATGPHLHYEFRLNGVHRNPLTVKLPAADPIATKYREDFDRSTASLITQLDILGETMVATAEQ